ncbi:MAG TPA: glycosyltransferase [bacterium]|nr:glycosyltransferase [bacterium]
MIPKVLICSASPDRLNHNAALLSYVGRGFSEALSPEQVMTSSYDYAVEAVQRFQPDLVVVFGSCMPACCDYTGLKNHCVKSGARLAFWLHDDPYEFDCNEKIYPYADFVFSNDQWAVTHIDHPKAFHLPLAADRQAHFRPIGEKMDRDIFFCGVGFPNRQQLLIDCAPMFSSFKVEVFGDKWPAFLSFCRNKRLSNESLPDYYASSLATLNVGRRFNLANSRYQLDARTPGPRTFEAAMAGAVQCVYLEGLELADYFEFDTEILVFDSPSELLSLIGMLKSDLKRRRQIAELAQARALKDHTYTNRADKLLTICGFSPVKRSSAG